MKYYGESCIMDENLRIKVTSWINTKVKDYKMDEILF
jgi:hypothetical protein